LNLKNSASARADFDVIKRGELNHAEKQGLPGFDPTPAIREVQVSDRGEQLLHIGLAFPQPLGHRECSAEKSPGVFQRNDIRVKPCDISFLNRDADLFSHR
jgi:hypothetical protein